MSWILSATSVAMMLLMGNRNKWGPRLGLINQILWLVYAISLKEWGLIPGVIMYTIVHTRNLIKWEKEN